MNVVPTDDRAIEASLLAVATLDEYLTDMATAPRRVSFRTSEIEQRQIASLFLAKSSLVADDDDDEGEAHESSDVCEHGAAAVACCDNNKPLLQNIILAEEEEEEEDEQDTDRGFELKTSLERQTRKFTILKSIVKSQHKCSPERLAMLARVCNKWAAEAAMAQGELDFQHVYQTTTTISKHSLPNMSGFPLPFRKKRSAEDNEDPTARRVRSRIY